MTTIKEFNNLDYLQAVRNDHLNPLIRRVENEIAPVLAKLEHEVTESVKNVTLTESTKTLRFDKGDGGYKDIDLTPIMPKFSGIGVKDIQDQGPSTGINLLRFPDATVTTNTPGDNVSVGFDWKSIFEHNQKWTEASVKGALSEMKSIIFTGDPDAVKVTGTNVTLKVPKMEPLLVTIPDGSPSIKVPTAVKEIELTGETGGCVIDAQGKMTLNLNAGGGGGTVTNQNFKGFFETLGDIISSVTDPLDGKSFAFAKDSTLGGLYYTPYFYVNGKWTELKQDPALTYNQPSTPTNQGVFSIKPSEKITIDANGQIDLDGLSTPQLPSHFRGFFTSITELDAAVPNPVLHQDWAYVNSNANGWLAYRSDQKGSDRIWNVIAPLGSFAVVDRKEDPSSYRQAFGIYKNDSWDIDDKGIMSLRESSMGGKTKVEIVDWDSKVKTGEFDTIQFRAGESYVHLNNNKLFIDNPQQIVQYTSDFEDDHNTQDYKGNIFYDELTSSWIGWSTPTAGGAVDKKWSHIAHRGMSDEVKGLTARNPPIAPDVVPGIVGDNRKWEHNGFTFIEKGSEHLPSDIKDICGGYITTTVQDQEEAGYRIPQYRIQTCLADRPEGGSYVRRFKPKNQTSTESWTPWVRTSFSNEDISDHNMDPDAHKNTFKYYRASTMTANLVNFAQQVEGGAPGGVRAENCDLMFDSHASVKQGEDYMDVPYKGSFRVKANFAISGYKEGAKDFPTGRWQALVRVKKKSATDWRTLGQYIYDHTDKKAKFPILDFETQKIDMDTNDQVIINLTFGGMSTVASQHPDLYFIPVKTYLLIEDIETKTGFYMAKTYSKHFATVDSSGAVGIRVHHANIPDPTTNIRVYGEKINKVPVVMKPV